MKSAQPRGGTQHYDTLVIGAGQAGVSLSYFLQAQGIDHVLVERETSFASWRNRWDGFYANTPNWMNTLPRDGFHTYPGGKPEGFASKKELVEYFEDYLREIQPPILSPCDVMEARQSADGKWRLKTSQGEFVGDNLAICTGAMSTPRIPRMSRALDPKVPQLHSLDYRSPNDIKTSRVLIVGSGSSGVQICKELCKTKKFDEIHLATSKVLVLPEYVLGIQVHRFLHMFSMFDVRVKSVLGRLMYGQLELKGDPIRPPTPKDLAKLEGVRLHERLISCQPGSVSFRDGSVVTDDDLTILWCTGYRGSYNWIRPRQGRLTIDERGYPVHDRGVVGPCRGLYFVGLRYQYTVASHDIYGVGQDARFVAESIAGGNTKHCVPQPPASARVGPITDSSKHTVAEVPYKAPKQTASDSSL